MICCNCDVIYDFQEENGLTKNLYVSSKLLKFDEFQYLQIRSETSILDTHYLLDQTALINKHYIDKLIVFF